RTTSPRWRDAAQWAVVAPTFPAPMTVILLRRDMVSSARRRYTDWLRGLSIAGNKRRTSGEIGLSHVACPDAPARQRPPRPLVAGLAMGNNLAVAPSASTLLI